jgi:hypothetical protein
MGGSRALALALALGGCTTEFPRYGGHDSTVIDAAAPDARVADARLADAAARDAVPPDAAPPDAGVVDAVVPDATPDACVPAEETCDGRDDDCDGQIDEADPLLGTNCAVHRPGACGTGKTACRDGRLVCAAADSGVPEECNGIDDDCDGEVDEDDPGGGADCSTGLGGLGPTCDRGHTHCVDGGLACRPVATVEEACGNRVDDDCDGEVDEDCGCSPGQTQACGTSEGACRAGLQTCFEGAWGECAGTTGPQAERCNGEDDDCDGRTDEDWAELGQPCVVDGRACPAGGVFQCAPDEVGPPICSRRPPDEVCNGVDDNCDGVVDEGCPCPEVDADGAGLCNGSERPACEYVYDGEEGDENTESCDDLCARAGGACTLARRGTHCGTATGQMIGCDVTAPKIRCTCAL